MNIYDLMEKLGVGHLPVYLEECEDGNLVHTIDNFDFENNPHTKTVRKAIEIDSYLKDLPVIELAEITWNDPKMRKTVAYVAGLIKSQESTDDLYLMFSDHSVPLGLMVYDVNGISTDGSNLEKISLIQDYKPLRYQHG